MRTVALPRIGTAAAWRTAARGLLAAQVPPEAVLWAWDSPAQIDLFGAEPAPVAPRGDVTVPKAFVALAENVCWHSDPERFARLYAFLWRLRRQPQLMVDRGDAQLATLRGMEKNVRRCAHKMTAFVRFRDLGEAGADGRRRFAAWFEPTHHTLEPTAPFFTRRFADMDWAIHTPDVTARFEGGQLSLHEGSPRPDLPEDGADELWGTYFRNIFNPARLKVKAMTSEMPRKYWKNLPEARHIPDLIANAEARAREMAEAAPTLPPVRAERILERLHAPGVLRGMTFDDLRKRAEAENRETQPGYGRIVLGEGPADARLMVVGEQPGDVEDREGRPFVGPAGQMFDTVAAEAGLERGAAYVTNAVKRFKFTLRGKRRIHQSPTSGDIEHARWWIAQELDLVQPKLILAMGGTAAETLTGSRKGILKRRGAVEETEYGPVFLTVHPSYLLRLPDAAAKAAETARFRDDLASVAKLVA
ncbi:putative uracil-DNA glycosylase [Oceanicola granulosus HTCC2516]|uniref:Type-4 uracil-DNA glycosylase n=1 Tax=Oceanicola granulosus (strain ATCC BAA-861 / DSM 15982 / KCTC 12143 / HTCC2516) TaxID=314256 RepID=Q2CAT3_OCEGH|nr:UdgX family uracil-DNA binding protein [Oceanicola granulosus]EAR49798.1 putative uracil-DNA glycosylase [Oceanicola granulosus HTCC2516]